MKCAECGSENPSGTKFCGKCGGALKTRCASCGADNPAQFRFCGECGRPLVPPASASPEQHLHEPPLLREEGERRQLTVLFSDLVNSTEIAARLDPEEWRDMVAEYQRLASEAVARFGGR